MSARALALVVAIILACAAALALAVHDSAFDLWAFDRMAAYSLAQPVPKLARSNELAVLLVGTGSPLPDRTRAGPCTLIAAGERLFVIDSGIASSRNLLLWRVPLNHVAAILLTHFHSDHIAELGELRLQTWVAGRKSPLPVYGPPGVDEVVDGFNRAYAFDASYRTAHHGAVMLPPGAVALVPHPVVIGTTPTATVLRSNGLVITAIRVHHDPAKPAYGYRFDFGGRSVTVSGDTAPDMDLARAAIGSDVLVHEALSPQLVAILRDEMLAHGRARAAKIMGDIPAYHTSPTDAARIANIAKVHLLVFTHIIPMLPNFIAERAFLVGVGDVRKRGVVLGHDGMIFRLPAGSNAIVRDQLD